MGRTITHVETEEPLIALTFDDGPHPSSTPDVLDVLGEHDAKATFFMVGEAVELYPRIADRVAREGHAIGNHSWSHPPFSKISHSERLAQVKKCEEVLPSTNISLFRPPYGNQSFSSWLSLWLKGYEVVTWNITPKDWKGRTASVMASDIVSNAEYGSIVLLHDSLYESMRNTHVGRGEIVETVSALLDQLGGEYRFVTVPELLQRGKPVRCYWVRKEI